MVFRFESVAAFSLALSETTGALPVPAGEQVRDGEWVLATFEIGSRRRATAAAARGVRAAGDVHITFERRDWDRLLAFVAARSEVMRAARPVGLADDGASISLREPPVSRRSADDEPPPSSLFDPSRIHARVLLVDHDATREELAGMLRDLGLTVETAGSTEAARAHLGASSFDAVVLGTDVAGLDPHAFVRDLRAGSDRKAAVIPVLILSAEPSSRSAVAAFASGADDFLARPFRSPELGARVFGLIRRARAVRTGSTPDSEGPPR